MVAWCDHHSGHEAVIRSSWNPVFPCLFLDVVHVPRYIGGWNFHCFLCHVLAIPRDCVCHVLQGFYLASDHEEKGGWAGQSILPTLNYFW